MKKLIIVAVLITALLTLYFAHSVIKPKPILQSLAPTEQGEFFAPDICTRTAVSEKLPSADDIYAAFLSWNGGDSMRCLFPSDIRINSQGERYWLVSFKMDPYGTISAVYDSQTKKISDSFNLESYMVENTDKSWLLVESSRIWHYSPNASNFTIIPDSVISSSVYEQYTLYGRGGPVAVIRELNSSTLRLDVFPTGYIVGKREKIPEDFFAKSTTLEVLRQKTFNLQID